MAIALRKLLGLQPDYFGVLHLVPRVLPWAIRSIGPSARSFRLLNHLQAHRLWERKRLADIREESCGEIAFKNLDEIRIAAGYEEVAAVRGDHEIAWVDAGMLIADAGDLTRSCDAINRDAVTLQAV